MNDNEGSGKGALSGERATTQKEGDVIFLREGEDERRHVTLQPATPEKSLTETSWRCARGGVAVTRLDLNRNLQLEHLSIFSWYWPERRNIKGHIYFRLFVRLGTRLSTQQ